jgi:type II secretory pathway predicted ATPase ExeA
VPRLVNAACDKALLAAYVEQSDRVTYAMVGRAIRELEGKVSA